MAIFRLSMGEYRKIHYQRRAPMSFELELSQKDNFDKVEDFVDFLIRQNYITDFYEKFKKGYVHEKIFRNLEDEDIVYEKCYDNYGKFLTVFSKESSKIFVYERGKVRSYDDFSSFLHNSIFTINFRGEFIRDLYSQNLLKYYTRNKDEPSFDKDFFLGSLTMFYLPENGLCIPTDNKWGFKIFELYKVINYQTTKTDLEFSLDLFKNYHKDKNSFIVYIAFMEFVLNNFNDKSKLSDYSNFFISFINNSKYEKYYIPPVFLEKIRSDIEHRHIHMETLLDKFSSDKLYSTFFTEALKDKDMFYNKRFEDYEADLIFDEEDYFISLEYALENFDSLSDNYFKGINYKIILDLADLGEGQSLHPLVQEFFQKLYETKKHLLIDFNDKIINKSFFLHNYLEASNKHTFINFITFFENFTDNRDCCKWFSKFEQCLLNNNIESLIYILELLKTSSNDEISTVEQRLLLHIEKNLLPYSISGNFKKKKIIQNIEKILENGKFISKEKIIQVRKTFPKFKRLHIDPTNFYKENLTPLLNDSVIKEENTAIMNSLESRMEPVIENPDIYTDVRKKIMDYQKKLSTANSSSKTGNDKENMSIDEPKADNDKRMSSKPVKKENLDSSPNKITEDSALNLLKSLVENPDSDAMEAFKSLLKDPNSSNLDTLAQVLREKDATPKQDNTKFIENKKEVNLGEEFTLIQEFEHFGNNLISLQKEIEAKINAKNQDRMFVAPKFLQKLYALKDDEKLEFEKDNIKIFIHYNRLIPSTIKIYKK